MKPVSKISDEDKNKTPESSGLTNKTLRGLSWTASGTIVQIVVQVIVTSVLARILSPADFGLVSVALIIVGLGQVFAQFGIGLALVQRYNVARRHIRTGFLVSVSFGLALTLCVVLLTPLIAAFFRLEASSDIIRVMAFIFLIKSFGVVSESLLQRELRFRTLTIVYAVSYLLGYGVVGIVSAVLYPSAWSLVAAQLTQVTLETVSMLILRRHSMRPHFNRRAFRDLIGYGGGMTAMKIANFVSLQGDNFIIGRWLGVESLGLYTRAYRLMSLPANLFNEAAEKIIFTTMSKAQMDAVRLRTAYRRGMAFISLLVIPISVAALILAPEIIFILLGPNWTAAVPVFQVLAIGMYFRSGYKMCYLVFQSTGAVNRTAWLKTVHAAMVLAGAIIGQSWGVVGASIGVVVSFVIHFALAVALGMKITKMSLTEHLVLYIPAVRLAAIVGAIAWSVASFLRGVAFPSAAIFFITLTTISFTVAVAAYFFPSLLGKENEWWLDILFSFFKKKKRISHLEEQVG